MTQILGQPCEFQVLVGRAEPSWRQQDKWTTARCVRPSPDGCHFLMGSPHCRVCGAAWVVSTAVPGGRTGLLLPAAKWASACRLMRFVTSHYMNAVAAVLSMFFVFCVFLVFLVVTPCSLRLCFVQPHCISPGSCFFDTLDAQRKTQVARPAQLNTRHTAACCACSKHAQNLACSLALL